MKGYRTLALSLSHYLSFFIPPLSLSSLSLFLLLSGALIVLSLCDDAYGVGQRMEVTLVLL